MNIEKFENYQRLAHAMQSGVATDQNTGSRCGEPKHLRVGINSAMSDAGGLVKLLIAKGLFTEDEYLDAITESMQNEVDRYEKLLSERLNTSVKLA